METDTKTDFLVSVSFRIMAYDIDHAKIIADEIFQSKFEANEFDELIVEVI